MANEPESYKVLHPTQRRFLLCFERSSSVVRAARAARISRQSHYTWLDNEEYAVAFEIAERRAARFLEDEAVQRATEGIKKVVWYKGKRVGHEMVKSDALLLALLRAHVPRFRCEPSTVIGVGGKDFSFEVARRLLQDGIDDQEHP